MNKSSSLYKLNLYFTIVILSFSAFIFYFIKKNEMVFLESFHKNQMNILKNTMNVYIESFKERYERDFNRLYFDIEFENVEENKKEYLEEWKQQQEINPSITWSYFAYGKDNLIITENWQKPEGYDLYGRSWYKLGLSSPENIVWSKPYIGPTTKILTISLVRGVKDQHGFVKGVFAMDINLATLIKSLKDVELSKGSLIVLLNENEEILGHNSDNELINTYKNTEWFHLTKDLNEGNIVTKDGSQVDFYTNSKYKWKLISVTPKDITGMYTNKLRNLMVVLLVVFIVVIFILYEIQVFKIVQKNKELTLLIRELREDNIYDFEKHRQKLNTKDYLYSEIYDEVYNLSVKWNKVGKELYKDDETGLYKKNYLEDNAGNWPKSSYELLLLTYSNLDEIREKYGESIAELVLKRGALVYKNHKKPGELGLRYNRDTLGLVVEKNDSRERINKIIKEIEEYKWKLTDLKVEVNWLTREINIKV